jgi:hypothetical protein
VKKGLTENAVEKAVGLGLSWASSKKKAVGKAAVAETRRLQKEPDIGTAPAFQMCQLGEFVRQFRVLDRVLPSCVL